MDSPPSAQPEAVVSTKKLSYFMKYDKQFSKSTFFLFHKVSIAFKIKPGSDLIMI